MDKISLILSPLKEKEREILSKRFGLFSEKGSTLAAIGKSLNLTRERIRQIQNSALAKIKNSNLQQSKPFSSIKKMAEEQGGLISYQDIKGKSIFILEATQGLKRIKGERSLNGVFILSNLKQNKIVAQEKEIINLLKKKDRALELEALLANFKNFSLVKSIINSSSSFAFDWKNRVGLSIWREVNPKSARDKSYYILKKEDRPLHFTHIAELISKENFAGKNPTAATVHNELILDERFVLVGRGIYALTEWGFKGGTVEEVIKDILEHHPQGMERDAIIKEVLKSKLVARNTVMMNLLTKKNFKRSKKGLYKLVK